MSKQFTPLHMEILFHYWVHGQEPFPRRSQVIQDYTDELKADGILRPFPGCEYLGVSEKGRRWIYMILETPYPVEQWVDPRTNEVLNPAWFD